MIHLKKEAGMNAHFIFSLGLIAFVLFLCFKFRNEKKK